MSVPNKACLHRGAESVPEHESRDLIPSTALQWRRRGAGWRLFSGRRSFGDVVPDGRCPGMWRSILTTGRLSDLANLSRARSAVLESARRELAWKIRQTGATAPSICPENRGGLEGASAQAAISASAGPLPASVFPAILEPAAATAAVLLEWRP
jgi:hypothetical protein